MKKSFFFSLLLGFGGILFANQEWEQFLRANKYFEEGNIVQARQEYETLPHKGPVVWFNLGNCLFQEGKTAEALAAWRAAEKEAPSYLLKQLQPKIRYALSELNQPHDLYIKNASEIFLGYIDLFLLQVLFILLWAFLWLRVFRIISFQRRYLYLLLFFCLMTLVVLGIKVWLSSFHYGIVTTERITVYTGPNKEFHEKGQWNYGTQFFITQKRDNWYKVKHDKVSGWVEESEIQYQD